MKPRRAIWAVCLLMAFVLVTGGSAEAASKPKKPKPSKPPVGPVWVGQVHKHGNHFDYVGSACPATADVCTAQVVKYRIIPTTDQARTALKKFKGGSAAIWGDRKKAKDHGHGGSLQAREIDVASQGSSNGTDGGAPGAPGQQTAGANGPDAKA